MSAVGKLNDFVARRVALDVSNVSVAAAECDVLIAAEEINLLADRRIAAQVEVLRGGVGVVKINLKRSVEVVTAARYRVGNVFRPSSSRSRYPIVWRISEVFNVKAVVRAVKNRSGFAHE